MFLALHILCVFPCLWNTTILFSYLFIFFILVVAYGILSCSMQDVIPRTGTEPEPPALRAWSQPLDHQRSLDAAILVVTQA